MSERQPIRVCIIYPTDPLGVSPGGIDPFIRGILRWAPDDMRFSMVGVTTEPDLRPVNEWSTCPVGEGSFEFLPILKFEDSGTQKKIPLTVRFVLALLRKRGEVAADVLEFHRIEPSLPFLGRHLPMTVVIHQNMQILKNRDSDIRWKYLPGLYFKLEDYIMARMHSIFCVRENAVEDYRQRYPALAEHVHFTPTWADTDKFSPPSDSERERLQKELTREFGFETGSFTFAWVGRLDSQKNPLLLIDAFARVVRAAPEARLLIVGDGVLREQVEKQIAKLHLDTKVVLCGLKSASEIALYLKAASAFALSSAYEGMPICVLEALASGLPVVSTDVGEISRVVLPGINGELVAEHEPKVLADAMQNCIRNVDSYRGTPCLDAVEPFSPQTVLQPFYENYRRLAASSVRQAARAGV